MVGRTFPCEAPCGRRCGTHVRAGGLNRGRRQAVLHEVSANVGVRRRLGAVFHEVVANVSGRVATPPSGPWRTSVTRVPLPDRMPGRAVAVVLPGPQEAVRVDLAPPDPPVTGAGAHRADPEVQMTADAACVARLADPSEGGAGFDVEPSMDP